MEIFYYAVIIDADAKVTFCNSEVTAKTEAENSAYKMDVWEEPYTIIIGKAYFDETGKLRPGKYIEQISNDKVWKRAIQEFDPYECANAWYKR